MKQKHEERYLCLEKNYLLNSPFVTHVTEFYARGSAGFVGNVQDKSLEYSDPRRS